MGKRKGVTSGILRNLEEKLKIVRKTKLYLQKELPRLREKEVVLRQKIGKERKAIALMNRAKKLR